MPKEVFLLLKMGKPNSHLQKSQAMITLFSEELEAMPEDKKLYLGDKESAYPPQYRIW